MAKYRASSTSNAVLATTKAATRPSTSQGERASTAKSIDMPTAMKNRPSSRPLNGSRSASSAWRYSESASSTPARKVPSAIDKPTASIINAMPTTSSSANAVNISRMSVRAIKRSAGRTR
ncbi:hypothetical protein D9M72_371060 [compost metagenome]